MIAISTIINGNRETMILFGNKLDQKESKSNDGGQTGRMIMTTDCKKISKLRPF